MLASAPVYACLGVIGVGLNLVVAIAIHLDTEMKNATYRFMVQLAMADSCLLFGLHVGLGIAVSSGYELSTDVIASKIFVYLGSVGFRVATFFMVLIAFSRWVYFVKKEKLDVWFSRKSHKMMCAFVWIFVLLFASPYLYYPNAFILMPNSGVYAYTNSTYSQVAQRFDEIVNASVMIIQILFNTMSMIWIIKLRKQILSLELQNRNRQELKLYALCLIDSLIFCLLATVYYVSSYTAISDAIGILSEILYFLNHVDCAILYLCLNRKLRLSIVKFLKFKVFRMKNQETTSPVFHIGGNGH